MTSLRETKTSSFFHLPSAIYEGLHSRHLQARLNTSAFSHHTSSIFPRVRQALAKRILAEVSEQREQCELTQTLPSRERSRRSQHEQTKKQAQQKMVEDSLTRAFDELHAGKAHRDARKLFKW